MKNSRTLENIFRGRQAGAVQEVKRLKKKFTEKENIFENIYRERQTGANQEAKPPTKENKIVIDAKINCH